MKAKDLSEAFYRTPEVARMTMTRKDLRELLLDTGGKILSCGRLRTVISKHIGAGVYEVTLSKEV